MMDFDTALTKENFLLYSAKAYNNPTCLGVSEFNSDMKRLMYIKRLLKKYERGHESDIQLVLNHTIIINNLFGPTATCRILFFYCESVIWPPLFEICKYLQILNVNIPELKGITEMKDKRISKILEEL